MGSASSCASNFQRLCRRQLSDRGNLLCRRFRRDAGLSWRTIQPGNELWFLSISCPSQTNCYAVGFDGEVGTDVVYITQDGWLTWSRHELDGEVRTDQIRCPDQLTCYIADAEAGFFVTKDAGATWKEFIVDDPAIPPPSTSISCPTVTTCFTLAAMISDGGASWITPPEWTLGAEDIDCPSASLCYAAGGPGQIFRYALP